jgi:trans-2,3-dihydro-3-hydroxyanthranilate isomerase
MAYLGVSPMRRYVTVDVFTDQPFRGNPLAVVLDAEGLTAEQMQAIASEFNYSETTFVLPARSPAHAAEVRIYTPTTEVPFAGHPNVGTALVLAAEWQSAGRPLPDGFVFEERAGLVPVRLQCRDGVAVSAELTAPQPLSLGAALSADAAAAVLGLAPEEVVTATHAPRVASVGLPFLIVEVVSREALRRSHGDRAVHEHVLRPAAVDGVYAYVRPAGSRMLEARMYAPLDNVPEDPATGSATVAAIALLATLEGRDGEQRWTVIQGEDMGRRSELHGRTVVDGGRLQSVHVGGAAVEVMRGSIRV